MTDLIQQKFGNWKLRLHYIGYEMPERAAPGRHDGPRCYELIRQKHFSIAAFA